MIQLDYRDSRPIYTQIAENIRNRIAAGVLQHEDKLPSVRELAAELSINPNTIQRAYHDLEMQGYIRSVPGLGCFVCAISGSTQTELIPAWLALDAAVRTLEQLGVSEEDVLRHIQKGGNAHD